MRNELITKGGALARLIQRSTDMFFAVNIISTTQGGDYTFILSPL